MNSRPVHTIRFGLIKCEILARHTKTGDRHVVMVTRLFRNGDQWQESKQFFRDDLLVLAKALDLAHSWIHAQCESYSARKTEPEATPS